jgi:hypothetical protein
MATNLKRIHYSGGLSQDRFLENGGGRRKPTLLRVQALLGEKTDLPPRTFGLILEINDSELPELAPKNENAERPALQILDGGAKNRRE